MKIVFMVMCMFAKGLIDAQSKHRRSHEYWDFSTVPSSKIHFPESFIFGCGVAEHQVSGADICKDSNWAFWENKVGIEPSGNACDFWNRCFDDISLIKNLGLQSFRFSVDWSMVEPQRGVFNEEAFAHYELFCKKLLENGIQPVVTLHHFSHPQWFEELGAFEKEENIGYFVHFSSEVFNRLSPYVHLWCTINEPSIYIFGGYIRANFPPGKGFPPGICHFQKAGVVLGNLLKSHVAIYKKIKSSPGGEAARVGIVHQMLPFKSFHKTGFRSSIEAFFADGLNHMLNDSVMDFFKTGKFLFSVPKIGMLAILPRITAHVRFDCPEAVNSLDFFGINYYSHVLLSINATTLFSEAYHKDDIKTDMPYAFYPEGLYHVIKEASVLGVPLYITENGIADEKDDKRALWIERHLYAVSKAIEDGYDVRGFFYWSLLDNFEWDLGYPPRFGLYHVDRVTQARTLRDGARAFEKIIKSQR